MSSEASRPTPESILVYVGLDLIGDGLIKLPFVRALRHAYPRARIVWLAGKGKSVYAGSLAPLVADLLDQVVEDAGIGSRAAELLRTPLRGTPLAGRRFDLILDTQRRVLTSLILRRIPHRRFVSGAAGFLLSNGRPPGGARKAPAMIRQLLDLLEAASGQPADIRPTAEEHLPAELIDMARSLLPDGASHVGLAPGAGGPHKRWPLERFIALGREQVAKGRSVVWLLGPDESDMIAPIRATLPDALLPLQDPRAAAAGGSPLLTIALAGRLAAAVANDAGTGHMLAAADVPLVSLFGPTPAEKFAPLVSSGRIVRAQDFGGETMEKIPETAVLTALEELLPG